MKLFEVVAQVAAVLGILACIVAGLARLAGSYYVAGYEGMTLFNAGVGLMVFSVLVKLEVLLRSR
ncbi:MAG: hypothetical protein KDI01_01235 [Halioglobus sp.]|nr:hypothetical protein [Halioglobus sp.]